MIATGGQLVILPIYPFHTLIFGVSGATLDYGANHILIDVDDWPWIKCWLMVMQIMPKMTLIGNVHEQGLPPYKPSIPICSIIFLYFPMFSYIFQCFPIFSNVFLYFPLFAYVSHVFIDFPMFSHVFSHAILCLALGVRQVHLPAPLPRARVLYPCRVPPPWRLGAGDPRILGKL